MKPDRRSQHLLNITKSKAKMWEYDIPVEHHITITESPEKLFALSIALLGDVAAEINRGYEDTDSFKELKSHLLFSADFFNSSDETKLFETLSSKLRLLSSAAFYLCDMPGNAKVLADSLEYSDLATKTDSLGLLLLRMLQDKYSTGLSRQNGDSDNITEELSALFTDFYIEGNPSAILRLVNRLRKAVYTNGTEEQLLLGDVIGAVARRKIDNASIRVLSNYTYIDIEQWRTALSKQSFIREFWPAQHLLGKIGILRGQSAIVQMPTSAGKTKSIELILRSAFLSRRTNLAAIIAPFRALCHEITDSLKLSFKDEDVGVDTLSDVLQDDYNLENLLGLSVKPQIIVVTPEKLLYILRHHLEIAEHLKLIFFDEGHQFDSGKRGITYELLLTSLKKFIPYEAQKILISAVIPNAEKIGSWLNGEETVAKGSDLIPTQKSFGFVSWKDSLGQIKYVDKTEDIFYVPRVIERHTLLRKVRERKERVFPQKDDGNDIALFLGLKLCANGGVAIFCGRKDTASNICKQAVEIVERGYPVGNLKDFSDYEELLAISALFEQNLGIESIGAKGAKIGVLAHHNNVPHGIRLAIEHAMREDKIRIIVCTSTLAQGVNLPIRYLIITSLYQGSDSIKVRDFHNLIGRAGRAGKHLEGSILFAESEIYDNKTERKKKWQWEKAQALLDISKSEDCISSLLTIFEPISNDNGKPLLNNGKPIPDLEKVIAFFLDDGIFLELATEIEKKLGASGFTINIVLPQLLQKKQQLESIENFLLAHWEDNNENIESWASELAKQTLAYHLADEEKKIQIVKVFQLLADNVAEKVSEPERKKVFSKTLYGINVTSKIEAWVNDKKDILMSIANMDSFINAIWQLFCEMVENNTNSSLFTRFDKPDVRKDILLAWTSGKSFAEHLKLLNEQGVHKKRGGQRCEFSVEDIVDVCENIFAFEGTLFVGAIIEFIDTFPDFDSLTKDLFKVFQKRIKYGLPNVSSINLYELGFSDRFLSQKIASLFQNQDLRKDEIQQKINEPDILKSIQALRLPSYYKGKLQLLQSGI